MSRDYTLPSWAQEELRYLRSRVAQIEATMPHEGRTLRLMTQHSEWCSGGDYCGCQSEQVTSDAEAELVCSDVGDGMHKPCIDIDMPVRLVESQTAGHFHLYIDKAVTWGRYLGMLQGMVDAGIVESGYLTATRKRGYSAVRHPDRLRKWV